MRTVVRRVIPRAIRNIARSPGRALASLFHEAAFQAGISRRCVIADDWAVQCHPAAAFVFRTHRSDRAFQRELAAFRAHSHPAMRLIDAGAHYGIFTLAALRHSAGSRVVAVDASPVAMRVLKANLALGGVEDRVEVVEAALGAEKGTLSMLSTGPASTHYMVFADPARPDARSIRMTTLDVLSDRFAEGPTHVKIDVEGFEEHVIRGGADTLGRFHPVVFLELHGAMIREHGGNPIAVLTLLGACGYRRFETEGQAVSVEWAAEQDLVRLVCLPD